MSSYQFWSLVCFQFGILTLLFLISQRLDWILERLKHSNDWLERMNDHQKHMRDNQRETIGLLERMLRDRE
jgi:hypothetical protein